MRYSLFFGACADADRVEAKVNETVTNLIDSYQSNDGETGVIEVRFFTNVPLDQWTQRYLLGVTRPITYALNCEE